MVRDTVEILTIQKPVITKTTENKSYLTTQVLTRGYEVVFSLFKMCLVFCEYNFKRSTLY